MLTPYIVDLSGLDADSARYAFNMMEKQGYTGAEFKPGTQLAYMFYDNDLTPDKLSTMLRVEVSRITDATGWDMIWWLHH